MVKTAPPRRGACETRKNAMSGTRSRRTHARRGLSIAEVLISLTISAFLLVAVAAAYSASADAVEMNDRFFRATQAGRVTMNQLLTEIRRADVVDVSIPNVIKVMRPPPNRLPNELERWYAYDPANKQVTLQIRYTSASLVPPSPKYSLSRNVELATFGPAEMDAGNTTVMRVPITLVVKIGSNEVRLSGSSGPRRAAKE
jgi:hypothetical protein